MSVENLQQITALKEAYKHTCEIRAEWYRIYDSYIIAWRKEDAARTKDDLWFIKRYNQIDNERAMANNRFDQLVEATSEWAERDLTNHAYNYGGDWVEVLNEYRAFRQ